MTRALFTGGGGAGNEALWRLLGDRYELHFGDADCTSIDPAIPADRRHQLPWATDPDFLVKMAALCRTLRIDVLVPGVDEELLKLSRSREALAPTTLLLPDSDYIEVMTDKLAMVQTLDSRGIAVPQTLRLDNAHDTLGFPCISKPRSGRGSRDVRVMSNVEEVQALRDALGAAAHGSVLQEKIEGVEYTVQMVANTAGQLHAVVPVRVDLKRGITLRAHTERNQVVIAACRAIHRAVPTGGCYNIQLILTSDDRAMPFEINPRVSTTLCLVIAAGIDPIAIYGYGPANDELLPFQENLSLQRHWQNFFRTEDIAES